MDSFKVYYYDNYMFGFTVVENDFFLLVKEDNLSAPRLFFKKSNQYSDSIHYSLMTNRMLEDGRQLLVNYNMGQIR